MRALLVTEFGEPSSLKISQVDEPSPGPNDVKIQVDGVGVGYFDGLLINGQYQIKPPLPFIPGSSLAGTVEATGDQVSNFKPGDKIAAFTFLGGLAEKAVLPQNTVFKLPDQIDPADAANFFISYATAVLGLKTLANTQPEQTVLILGASGSTGTTAIETAKALGAKVIACASTEEKRQHCLRNGADHAIDYTNPDWRKQVKVLAPGGVDVIYDPIGGEWAEPALRCAAPGGRYLVVGFVAGIASVPLNLPLLKRCSIIGVNWGAESMANPAIVAPVINQIIEWTLDGKLKTGDAQIFSLEQAGAAFANLFSRKSHGKIVVKPNL